MYQFRNLIYLKIAQNIQILSVFEFNINIIILIIQISNIPSVGKINVLGDLTDGRIFILLLLQFVDDYMAELAPLSNEEKLPEDRFILIKTVFSSKCYYFLLTYFLLTYFLLTYHVLNFLGYKTIFYLFLPKIKTAEKSRLINYQQIVIFTFYKSLFIKIL